MYNPAGISAHVAVLPVRVRRIYIITAVVLCFALILQGGLPGSILAASADRKAPEFPAPGALQKTLDYRQAIENYTKAIQQRPKDPVAYYNRGMVCSALGMYDEALADYEKAISLRPNALQPYIGKLGALYGAGMYEQLLEVADFVVANFDSHPWGHYWRGRALLAKGQYRKAVEDFTKYLAGEQNPERISDACYNLASALVELGEYNAAIDRLNMAIVKNPLNFENWVLRGIVYKNKLEYGPALRDLQRGFLISRNTSILACNSIAWILATCPNPEFRNGVEALKMARMAVELDDSKPYYHDTLAAACAEAGLFKEAVEEQKKALKLLAGVPESQRAQIAARYEKRLKLYEENKPFRDVEE